MALRISNGNFESRIALDAPSKIAWVAQLVERVLGKDEVTGSIPVPGSSGLCLDFVEQGGGNSTVESRSSKAMVAGSNPVPRSIVLA